MFYHTDETYAFDVVRIGWLAVLLDKARVRNKSYYVNVDAKGKTFNIMCI